MQKILASQTEPPAVSFGAIPKDGDEEEKKEEDEENEAEEGEEELDEPEDDIESKSAIDFPKRVIKRRNILGTKMLQQALNQVIDQNRQEKEASKTPKPGED